MTTKLRGKEVTNSTAASSSNEEGNGSNNSSDRKRMNWDFTNLNQESSNGLKLADPIGFKCEDPNAVVAKKQEGTANKALLEKKAWEAAIAPVQQVRGML
jgi:hypothetical protein